MFVDIVKKAGFLIIAVLVIWFAIILILGLIKLLLAVLLVVVVVSLLIWGYNKVFGGRR